MISKKFGSIQLIIGQYNKQNRYLNLIFEEISFLTLNPFEGDNFSHVRKGYFRSKVKSQLIFYSIDEKKKLLEIIRILHIQMDVDNHLNK
jgi:toxin ParE1/3/4